MKFKVGDIVRFNRGRGRTSTFKEFMYDRDHIVTRVGEESIRTKGNGWCYNEEHHSPHNELNTNKVYWEYIELVNNNSWDGSTLKFNFIK
jgi:hypothetical protein